MRAVDVYVRVYVLDAHRFIRTISNLFTCGAVDIHHCTLVVYNSEWCFYAHPFQVSGVVERSLSDRPLSIDLQLIKAKLKKEILIGSTHLWKYQIQWLIDQLSRSRYNGCQYRLLTRNCNSFVHDIVWLLTGKIIPRWIQRAEHICSKNKRFLQLQNIKPNLESGKWVIEQYFMRSEGNIEATLDALNVTRDAERTYYYKYMSNMLLSEAIFCIPARSGRSPWLAPESVSSFFNDRPMLQGCKHSIQISNNYHSNLACV
ncbi:hypothetical protein GJ496_000644 [Pomphorhynchus laevis]|nr:hypothetical protein GJ496_000644 [Pomphorhynchus laevis]